MATTNYQYDLAKPSKSEVLLEGKFWELIRKDLLMYAEGESSDPFYKILESKINSMGPEGLKRLYIEVNKGE